MPFFAQFVITSFLIVLIDSIQYDDPIPLVQNWKEECLLDCLMKQDTNCSDFRRIDSPAMFSKCLKDAFAETKPKEYSIPCFYDNQCRILRSPADYPTKRLATKQKLIQVRSINSTTAEITAAEIEQDTPLGWTMIISTKSIFEDNFWEILGVITSEIPTEPLIMSNPNLCEPVHARAMLIVENIVGSIEIYESEPVEMSRLVRIDDFRFQRASMEYLPDIDQIEAVYSITNPGGNVDHDWPSPTPNVSVTPHHLSCLRGAWNEESKLFSLQQISRLIDGWNFTVHFNSNWTIRCYQPTVFVQVNLTLPCFGVVQSSLTETFKCNNENNPDCLKEFENATPNASYIFNASSTSDANQQPGFYPELFTSHVSKLWESSDIAQLDNLNYTLMTAQLNSLTFQATFYSSGNINSHARCANAHIVLKNGGSSCSNGQRVRSDDDDRCCVILRLMSPINVHNHSDVVIVPFPESVQTYRCQFYFDINCWYSLNQKQWESFSYKSIPVIFEPAGADYDSNPLRDNVTDLISSNSYSKKFDTNKLSPLKVDQSPSDPSDQQSINPAGSTSVGKHMDSNTKLAIAVAVPLSLLLILTSAGILLYFYRHDVQRRIRKGSSKKSQAKPTNSDLEMEPPNLKNSAHYDYDRSKLAPATRSDNSSTNGTIVPSDVPNSRRPARKFLRLEQDLLQPPGKNYYSKDPLTSSPSGHSKNDYSNFSVKNNIVLPSSAK